MSIPIKSSYIALTPTSPTAVPPNSVFVDSTSANQLTNKTNSGSLVDLGVSVFNNYFEKQMQSDAAFPVNSPLAKLPNGRVIKADSDDAAAQNFCGYALQESLTAGQTVNVLLVGANIINAVIGLGFAPGDVVYINNAGGYTNDPSTFLPGVDTIIQAGIADCPAGPTASPIATDLITAADYVAGA